MASKNDFNYFEQFVALAAESQRAARLLEEIFASYSSTTLPERMREMHAIEHAADDLRHELTNNLVKEFITPIEREDIIQIANRVDDVVDSIDDVVMKLYMYNVAGLRAETLTFSAVITRCTAALGKLLAEFENFRRSTTLKQLVIDVDRIEEEGDAIHRDAVRRLYLSGGDPIEVMVWTALFEALERCCDCCEDVSNAVESIAMKNS